ncbi:hypothetical protein D3C79_605790 [compost metagenome]
MFARGLDGAGQVAGVHGEIPDAPVTALDRLQDRTQPGFFAVATQQPESTIEVFAAADGAFHALVEIELFQVFRHDVFNIAPDQLLAAVQHLFLEIAVDQLDTPLGVELEHQHFAVQAVLDLLDGMKLLSQLLDFFFELAVEHHRSRSESPDRMHLHRLPGRALE